MFHWSRRNKIGKKTLDVQGMDVGVTKRIANIRFADDFFHLVGMLWA